MSFTKTPNHEIALYPADDTTTRMDIQCQPIVVDGVLFGTTPTHKLFAVSASTGDRETLVHFLMNLGEKPTATASKLLVVSFSPISCLKCPKK